MMRQLFIGLVCAVVAMGLLVLMAILDAPSQPTATPAPIPCYMPYMKDGCVHQYSQGRWIKTCG